MKIPHLETDSIEEHLVAVAERVTLLSEIDRRPINKVAEAIERALIEDPNFQRDGSPTMLFALAAIEMAKRWDADPAFKARLSAAIAK